MTNNTGVQLVLKVVAADLTAYGGFQYPSQGYVEAPDWRNDAAPGGGLHGWLNGEGNYVHAHAPDARWLVIEPDQTGRYIYGKAGTLTYRDKFKFKSGTVVYCGDRAGAVAYMVACGAITASSDVSVVCLTADQAQAVSQQARARNPDPNHSNNYPAMAARFAGELAVHGPTRATDGASLAGLTCAFQVIVPLTPVHEREAFRLDKLRAIGVAV